MLLIVFLPTQLGKHFFLDFSYLSGVRVDYLSPTIYFIDFIIMALFFAHIKDVMKFFRRKVFFYLAILLAFNVALAQSPPLALYGAFRIIELLVVISLGSRLIGSIGTRIILFSFTLPAVMELGLSAAQLFFKHSIQGPFYFIGERLFSVGTPGIAKIAINGLEYLRPYGSFSHPNSMAGFYLLVYFFILTNRIFDKHVLLKYFSLLIFSCLVFISFSKAAIVTFLLLNITHLVFNRQNICRICVISRLMVLAVISAIFLIPSGDPLTALKRFELMGNSVNVILKNPVTGVGANNYLIAQSQYASKFPFFFNQPVHNIILLFLSEMGIIGGGLILFQMGRFLKRNLRGSGWLLVAAIFMTGLVDHYWVTLIQNTMVAGVIFSISFRDLFLPAGSAFPIVSKTHRSRSARSSSTRQ